MNRCRTRRWMALFAGAIMAATMLFAAIPVYAELGVPVGDDGYIERIYKPDKQLDGTYKLKVDFIGYEEYEGAIALLAPCTIEALDVDGMTALVERKSSEDSDKWESEPNEDGETRTIYRYELKFSNLKIPFGTNTFAMTIRRAVDQKPVYYTKSLPDFLDTGSSSGGGLTPGTGDDDDDDEKETPIAALKPHLIVDSYSYGEAVAGQDVPVTFTLKNTSANKAVRNVVLNVKPAGDLRIKSASDTIFVDTILPGKTVTKTMNFFLGANTSVKVQEIGIASTFEYFDIEGQNAVSGGDNVTISIPTDTIERVRIQKVELPQMIYPGSEEEITYSVVNAGFATLYNCEIRVVDEADTEYAYAYIGSLDPSKAASETYLPIVLDTPGETHLKFVFTYENDRLQAGEVTRDFTATVMEIPEYIEPPITEPFPPEEFPAEGQGMPLWLLLTIIGGGIVVVIVAAVIIVKVVKKKRSELDDEDI